MPAKKEEKAVAAEKAAPKAAAAGSDSNLIAAIAELFALGTLIPILLYFVKKDDKFVKFHALQATFLGIVVWAIIVVFAGLGFALGLVAGPAGLIGACCYPTYGVGALVAIYLAYMAYQGKTYKLPVIGDMAQKYV